MDPAERGIAMVFQTYALYPHMTVEENMGFSLRMNGVDKGIVHTKVVAAAKALQLEELLKRKPKELSGGQRQRVAIGRAIVRDPKVFLFDEPLSNLDAELRVDMRLQIASLHEELKNTMIYVTHDQVEAMTLADKIVVLRLGNIEQVGSPLELYNSPANEFVAGFIGSPKMNIVPATVVEVSNSALTIRTPDQQVFTIEADTTGISEGDKVNFGVRPEHLFIDKKGEHTLHFTTHAVERLGNSTYLFGQVGGYDNFKVHVGGDMDVKRGDELELNFDLNNCHLFSDGKCITNL
ncbi:maltose/maltodextrin transport ATP-binding protein malK [Vibrio ishigakensis]|uniref:Maltose/maltodextrin transport ATP-binding protein malK n=1 Tax=Vibrio ishigakensis TaxID=1481914 RepID=A0A0B8NUJ5_9VIBR|nr:maltose/maltodextrin transport ATP-binding protein malK [Vibrio ishigakensis]